MYLADEQNYIDKLTAIVEENFSNSSFGVAELAREMGISHSTLHRKLKSVARQSISQFIREIRLKRAMELLKLQFSTVAEVAYSVGFGSTTYFTKCFHEYFGYPPGEVKKRYISGLGIVENKESAIRDLEQVQSIAVLPFINCSVDNSQDFLVVGIHDALVGELGQLGSIRVLSKTSVSAYTGTEKTIEAIASELGVDGIVEGSVLFIDELIRIQLKLVKALPEERQLWYQTFDVEMDNILKLYSHIISKIASEIQLTLSPAQITQITNRRVVNPESYKAYLRGRYHLYQLTEESIRLGLECLHDAVRIDPSEPFAHAGLALGYMEIAHGPLNPGDAYIKAESAAIQALKIDPNLAEAQLALAELYMYSTWKFNEAEKYFRLALEINPYLSIAHYHYAWLLFLLGRHQEAETEHEFAQRYDPFNPMIVGHMALLYSFLGRYQDAILQVKKSFEVQKACPDGYYALVETYLALGKEEDAIATSKEFVEASPEWLWVLGYTLAITNRREEAKSILEELLKDKITSWTAFGIAGIYISLGNMDQAFEWMSYEPHHAWVPWLSVIPMGKPLYNDPRFMDFLMRWNIPDH